MATLALLIKASGSGRRSSVRARWARDDFERLQPTAPGLVWPLGFLAAAQGSSCGVRERELQVRAHGCIAAVSALVQIWGGFNRVVGALQGFSSVGLTSGAGVLARRVQEDAQSESET